MSARFDSWKFLADTAPYKALWYSVNMSCRVRLLVAQVGRQVDLVDHIIGKIAGEGDHY